MSAHVLYAFDLAGGGPAQALTGEDIVKGLQDDQLAWVHLHGDHDETKVWLEKEISYLDPYIISALLEEETRPRMTPIGDGALIIFRGVNLNEGAQAEDMVSVRMYLDASRIISIERREVRAIRDLSQSLRDNRGPKNAGDFLTRLIRNLNGRIEHVFAELEDKTDALEENIITSQSPEIRRDIIQIRRKALELRRHLSPQREVLSQIRLADELKWLSESHRRSLQESYNQTVRIIEELDSVRERAQIIKDELANMISDRLNRNTYVLSVIAAIFLPLGFLTGLFGINIGGLPGVENGNAFLIFCIAMTAVVILQIFLFRKFKWF